MAIGSPEVSEICILGPIRRHMNAGNLKLRRCSYTLCTRPNNLFLDSVSLKLPFDINIVFVQTRYHGNRKPRSFGNLDCRPYMAIHEKGNLKLRRCSYTFCTTPKIIFLDSASLKLPFHISIVLVQTRYHCDRKTRSFGNLHCRPYLAKHDCG